MSHCGFWNVHGIAGFNSDKLNYCIACTESVDVKIIGVAETQLNNNDCIEVNNYIWIGHNRKLRKKKAMWASGGVGVLVHKDLVDICSIEILVKSHQGILWIKL